MADILFAQCASCNNEWMPYGSQPFVVPHKARITCPKCGTVTDYEWNDAETKALLKRKALGLMSDSGINELSELKGRIQALELQVAAIKELVDVESKRRALTESQLNSIQEWAKVREQDFKAIEDLAKEIEEEERFRNDNK